MAESIFPPPPGTKRRSPEDSLQRVQEHAKACAVAIGKLDLDEVLKKGLFEMNGREAVLAFLLREALDRIEALEAKTHLLLATASCPVDDITALMGETTEENENEENEKEESK